MTEHKAGDVVTLGHKDGARLVRQLISDDQGFLCIVAVTDKIRIETIGEFGWHVIDNKPKIELPTEPGIYLDREERVWELDDNKDLVMGNYDYHNDLAPDPEDHAPFTRLVPEGGEREAAICEVIAWYDDWLPDAYANGYELAEQHFGITK